jgi:hypothetical protein
MASLDTTIGILSALSQNGHNVSTLADNIRELIKQSQAVPPSVAAGGALISGAMGVVSKALPSAAATGASLADWLPAATLLAGVPVGLGGAKLVHSFTRDPRASKSVEALVQDEMNDDLTKELRFRNKLLLDKVKNKINKKSS